MCGISGFLTAPGQSRDALVRTATAMADTLRHRGPDDAGAWADEASGAALGFRRLAIIDLSEHGRQPMHSASGRYVIVLTGEIYNFQALRKPLEREGHRFVGRSDVEVALAVIERDGVARALEEFNGMFAFALWDGHERTLTIARDRFGEKPLYYGWCGGTLLFGSELKALRRHPDFSASIDRDALAEFARLGFVPCPRSIYAGISKLPPGCFAVVSAARRGAPVVPVSYWSAASVVEHGLANPFTGSEDEALAELDAVLRDAVSVRMLADVPLGAFLSGGIDSSLIVSLMQAQSPTPVRTFTIGFGETGFDEARDARAVARHLGTNHTEFTVRPADALAVIARLPELYDEPFADSSQIPTFVVSSLARRHVTVALSGDGGDELFGGYNRHVWAGRLWSAAGWLPRSVRRVAGQALRSPAPETWDRLYGAAAAVLPGRLRIRNAGEKLHKLGAVAAVSTARELYAALASTWPDARRVVVGASSAPMLEWSDARPPVIDDLANWMMYRDSVTYLPDDILAKVDRASMGASLEARVPFLAPRVYALAWRLPLAMKIRGGRGKWLLRRALERYVPAALFERPKMGFAVPVGAWLRGPLREWAHALLDPAKLRREGFFDARIIEAMWRAHLRGGTDWQHRLWTVLMFQSWRADKDVD